MNIKNHEDASQEQHFDNNLLINPAKENNNMFRIDMPLQSTQLPKSIQIAAQPATTWNNIAAQKIFRQLGLTLLTLKQSAEMLGATNLSDAEQQTIRYKLQPRLRRANDSLQDLRRLPVAQHPDTVELVQCMTVLILAVDMHLNSYLAINQNAESYDMFQRNIDRAIHSLNDLRSYWDESIRAS